MAHHTDHRSDKTVIITPLVTRHKGVEYSEMGAGGGQGDLDQIHELELWDIAAVGSLIEFCSKKLHDKPELQQKVLAWLAKSVKQGGQNVRIDTAGFFEALYGDDKEADALDDAPLDRLLDSLEVLVAEKPKDDIPLARHVVSGLYGGLRIEADRPRQTFPYSRHASYEELRALVKAFSPKELYPNTIEAGLDMDALFWDLLGHGVADSEPPNTKTTVKTSNEKPSVTPAKRSKPPSLDDGESTVRRIKAFEAALGVGNRSWGTDVTLASVEGYHNQEPEVEL